MKIHVHIVSSPTGSIGEITHDLTEWLKQDSSFVITQESKGEEPEKYDILLSHFINLSIVDKKLVFDKFKKKILIQPIDRTSIKKEFIEAINYYDYIITPAEAGKNIMLNNNIERPITVIPNYYKDITLYNPNVEISGIPNDKIVFYHESTLHPRKGVESLYKGFVKAFSDTALVDNVCLVVKTSPHNHITFKETERLKKETIELQKKYKKPAQIIKISQDLKEETLKKLWSKTSIYVSFAGIEGFGIPLLRMASLGVPIVTLDPKGISGYGDYLNKENSYFVNSHLDKAQGEFMNMYNEDLLWTWGNEADICRNYRLAFYDYMSGKSKVVAKGSLKGFKYEEVMRDYVDFLKSINI